VAALNEEALRALVTRHDYRAIATELVQLERARGAISIDGLTEDPSSAIEASAEVSIEYDTTLPRGCSVFGYYRYRTDSAATICVHPSWTTARDSFTIIHEYGHHVQRQHPEWANVRFGYPSKIGARLEERVADAFAAEVLMPANLSTADTNWLDAKTLAAVHSRVRASRLSALFENQSSFAL
jgi:Zn-dependent peptidase ImmA (M78 family)